MLELPPQWEAFVSRCPQNGILPYQLGNVQTALVESSTGFKKSLIIHNEKTKEIIVLMSVLIPDKDTA